MVSESLIGKWKNASSETELRECLQILQRNAIEFYDDQLNLFLEIVNFGMKNFNFGFTEEELKFLGKSFCVIFKNFKSNDFELLPQNDLSEFVGLFTNLLIGTTAYDIQNMTDMSRTTLDILNFSFKKTEAPRGKFSLRVLIHPISDILNSLPPNSKSIGLLNQYLTLITFENELHQENDKLVDIPTIPEYVSNLKNSNVLYTQWLNDLKAENEKFRFTFLLLTESSPNENIWYETALNLIEGRTL